MGKGGSDPSLYGSPVPFIGLYIAAATWVCLFSMTFDLVYGLFIRKRPLIPCKLFAINSFTMMMLSIATKIPVDLTTPMPRAEDQLSKLTGTALMCTSLGFYMPSLGTMGTFECYSNMAALSVMVIAMVVNVCIQIGTRVIFAFTIEHIIIVVCNLVLLLFLWSSAIGFRGIKDFINFFFPERFEDEINAKGLEGLKNLLARIHVLNYTGNAQTIFCETSHHHVVGLSCALSSAVILQAMLKSFALKNVTILRSSSDVSDYKWSIPIILVSQFLTIAVGTLTIIYRWLSLVIHVEDPVSDEGNRFFIFTQPELLENQMLKTLPFRFFKKNNCNKYIVEVLMLIHMGLCICSILILLLIHIIKKFLVYIIPFGRIFHEHTDDDQDIEEEMATPRAEDFAISFDDTFGRWKTKMALKDMMRWRNKYKRDTPTHLIQLISKCCLASSASKLQCVFSFIKKLEDTGEKLLRESRIDPEFKYDYRVSCLSVLVLSGMLSELLPSSRRESLMHNLNESFESIYYVDQKATDTPSRLDGERWASAKDLWLRWQNPKHWFWTKIISPVFKSSSLKKSEESELELHHILGFLECPIQAPEEFFDQNIGVLALQSLEGDPWTSLAEKHMALIAIEFSIICKFIQEQNYESVENLFDFLEDCFAKLLYYFLHRLPMAIFKDIVGQDPTEISEGSVRKALKFLCKLELLGDAIEWSWPDILDPNSQANDGQSLVQAKPNQTCSTSIADADDGDDDTIREVGTDENV